MAESLMLIMWSLRSASRSEILRLLYQLFRRGNSLHYRDCYWELWRIIVIWESMMLIVAYDYFLRLKWFLSKWPKRLSSTKNHDSYKIECTSSLFFEIQILSYSTTEESTEKIANEAHKICQLIMCSIFRLNCFYTRWVQK